MFSRIGNFFGNAVDWLGGAAEDVGGFLGDAAETLARLPNEIIDFGTRLGVSQREAAAGATSEARRFETRRLFGEAGPAILIGGIALLVVLLAKK